MDRGSNKQRKIKQMTAWLLLVAMGINCFGQYVPSGVGTVHATDYEKGSEEVEEIIREAEKAAGIGVEDDESGNDEDYISKDTTKNQIQEENPVSEEEYLETISGETAGEEITYESMTISTATTLKEDMEVGDLQVNNDLHLNGHKLVVHGNVILNSGLYMEDGYLLVMGNFQEGYDAQINMTSVNDYIQIKGDYIFSYRYTYIHSRDKGIFEIRGDVYGTSDNYCSSNIQFGVDCKVVLGGDNEQQIDIRTDSRLVIKHLVITNSSEEGVLSKHMLMADVIEDEERKLHYPSEGEIGTTLTEDMEIMGDYSLLGGTLDLAGYNLVIHGNLIHAGGTIQVNGGSLIVDGDYKRQYFYEENGVEIEEYSAGRLIMDKDADYVLIKGNYVDCGVRETESDLTAGVLELQGSITAKDNYRHPLLQTIGTHTIKLTGAGNQLLQTGNSYTGDNFRFSHFVVSQPESGSVKWDGVIIINGGIVHESANIEGITKLEGAVVQSADLYGAIQITDNYRFQTDVTLHGDLWVGYNDYYGNTLTISNCHVTVKGNYHHTNVTLDLVGEAPVFTVEQDFIMTDRSYNTVSAGTVEIGGDIRATGEASLSFEEGTEVRFIGNTKQRVSIVYQKTLFTNVLVDNPAGVVVEDGITVLNVTCKQGVLSYASGAVHGFTLEEDGEYNGDLVIGGGAFNLNGHKYHIKGNLTIAGGTLNMTHEEDYLLVDGDFQAASTLDHEGKLTAGTLEIKGDFTQTGNSYSFVATEQHRVLFSGEVKQTITFSAPKYSSLSNVDIQNENGIIISGEMPVCGNMKKNGPVEGWLGARKGITFSDGKYQGNVSVLENTTLAADLTIDGNLRLTEYSGNLYLNGKVLNVTGEVSISNYTDIYLDKGHLICGSYADSWYGSVRMQYDTDRLTVAGSLSMSCQSANIRNGHIKAAGDVVLQESVAYSFGNTLKMELNGTQRQTITMNGNNQSFGILILNNTSQEGVYVTKSLNYKTLQNPAGTKVTFANGGILGYTLQADEVIKGDLLLAGGTMDLNGHSLTVTGNLRQSGGILNVNRGTLVVEGDYALANWTEAEDGSCIYSTSNGSLQIQQKADIVTVKGNFYSYSTLSLTNGILNIEGDWEIANRVTGNALTINSKGDWTAINRVDLSNGCNLILTGEIQQVFSSYNYNYRFGDVTINNPMGLLIKNGYTKDKVEVYGELYTNGYPLDAEWVMLYGTIKDDRVSANIYFTDVQVSRLEKDLYVDGNVSMGGLYLNGYHLTVAGDCTTNYLYNSNVIQENGILEVKGDLQYSSSYSKYTGTGTNQVILSGDKKQTIYSRNQTWTFHELIIRNTSEEGVYSQELLDIDIVSDPDHKLVFPIEGSCGYTLTKDTVIQGDFTLLAGKMDLNGHKLTVMGTITQRGGSFDINSGMLQVYGNYIIGNPSTAGTYQKCTAALQMDDEKDYVCVEGNVVWASSVVHINYLTTGTMEIKGNFTYYDVDKIYQKFGKGFCMLFSGADKQTIQNMTSLTYFYLPAIDIRNTSAEGVVVASDIRITNPVTGTGRLQGTPGTTLYWNNGQPLYMESWNGDLNLESAITMTKDLNADGTLTVGNTLNLNGKHLTVDNMAVNSTLEIHGGILQVKGNLDFASSSSYKPVMTMDTEQDILQITGNFTATRGTLNLTAGQLEVKGNLNLSGGTVNVGDTHTTTLNGKMTARGTAYIQTITIPEGTTLNTLILTKPRSYYVFNREVEGMCRELIEDIQDITAPSAPGGLSATDISYTKLTLSWQAATDDVGVAGYDVFRNDKKIMSVTGTSYIDKNLTPGTEYSYYVIAKDATLNTSAASQTLTVTTLEDTEAPAVPEGLVLTERLGTALKLSWQESADNVKTTGYRIYRDGKEIATTKNTEYMDTGLFTNAPYVYTVSAYDDKENESEQSEEGDFYTQAVEIGNILPVEYAKLSGKESAIEISFTNAGSTAGYQVYVGYREITKGNEDASYQQLYSGTAGKGTAYRKQITVKSAVPAAKIESDEIEVLVRITDAGGYETEETYTYYLDKSAPSKLSEVGGRVEDGVAIISYAKGIEADIAGYYIYRGIGEHTDVQSGRGEAEQIADIAEANKTYYYDKTMEEGVTYTYYVAAYDEEGQVGEWSDPVILLCSADESAPVIENVEPANGILFGKAELTIQARDNKALDKAVVELYRETQEDYQVIAECPFEQGTASCLIDTTQYSDEITLCITVLDTAGNENETEYIKTYGIDNQGPEQIQNLTAKITSTTVVLTWDAPTESDDFAYFLLEEQQEDGSFTEIARTTTVTGYAIEGLIPQSIHTYRVTGYDIRGNAGEPSKPLTITVDEDTIAPRITSVTPNGGFFHDVIPLSVTAYDNLALSEVIIEYSADQETWQELIRESLTEPAKTYTLRYDYSLEEVSEGDCYIRAYGVDAAGNMGDTGQILIQYEVDKTAPSAVQSLTAEGMAGSIYLSWSEPVENDVDHYRVYRSPEGLNSYTCVADSVRSLGWYDRTVAYDTSYSYRVTAVDRAGNESAYSNVVVAQKFPDDEAPVIYSLLPAEDEWICGEYEMSVYLTDNDRLSTVEFALKEQGSGATKMIVDTVRTDISEGTVTCKLDTRVYENGVYQILVTARDASGNSSKTYTSLCHISNETLPTPEFYAVAGNWCTELHYSGNSGESYVVYKKKVGEDDFSILTSGIGSLMYRDLEVHPSYTYVYQMMIMDKAGNTAWSVLCNVKPIPVDDRKPTVVLQADTSVIQGYQMVFNGLGSTDNDKVESYRWDFGDGSDIGNGPTPIHTYKKVGEYYVTLTVADPSGNTEYKTIKVKVLPKDSAGKAVIEVRNAAGTPLKDVTVFVNTSTEHNDMCYTDKHGTANIMQEAGTYRVALYKPGYVATEVSVEVELHGERNYVFTLAEGETMTADFNVRQMTFEEMVEAGIDIRDPANQHVFTVQTKLQFSDEIRTDDGKLTLPLIPAQTIISKKSKGGSSSSSGGGGGDGPNDGDGPSNPQEEEEEPEDEMLYTICITQSISWLKDMYEATLIVYNNANSQTIVARDLTTRLELPLGISLAGTSGGQSLTKEMLDIRGGDSKAVTWYLRGDAPGKYKLKAMMAGKLQPFNADMSCQFVSNEFEVTAGEGLVLTIQPEDRAEKGELYYVYFTLSNAGNKEFYNVYTTFGTEFNNSRRYIASTDGTKRVPVMSAGDSVVVECLKPGECISGVYKRVLPVEGEKYVNYKKLVNFEYEVLEGANLGVKISISPVASHVPVPDLTYQTPTDDNSEADPVNVSTGAYTDSITALSIQGVNPVTADLSYDSTATEELGEFGYGWTHNYEARIVDMKDGTVRYYVSPTGYYTFLAEDYEDKAKYSINEQGYYYLDISDIPIEQNFQCLNDNKAGFVLKRNDGGTFTLTDKADTVTEFDKKGNLTSIRNPDGKEITVSRTDKSFTVKDKTSGRKLIYTLNDDKLVESVEDSTGREAFFYYTKDKCLKQFTNALGENTYYTYNEQHCILTVTDDDGNTYVTNTYEEYKSPYAPDKKVARVISQKDGLGNVTKFSYNEDDQSGDMVTTVTTRSGKKKKTVTDAYGNITCTTNEAGDETLTTYDADGNETANHNANGYSTVYHYDSNGNLTSIENSLMDGSTAETVMGYDAKGNMTSMVNTNGESMSCTYYDNGLIKSVTDQNGNTISYLYNGWGQLEKETDGNGKTIHYDYNSKGDLEKVTDRNGNVTEYAYNDMGLLETTTVEAGGETYTTETYYDDLGRTSYTIDTEGGVTSYEYDCAGNIISRTDPAGAMTVYAYDDNYQMVKETVYATEEGNITTSTTDYTYTKEGLLETVTDGATGTVVTNSYDAVGNKIKEVEENKKKLSEIQYEYDKAGNVTKQTRINVEPKEGEPEELSAEYKYYPNGNLNYVIDTAGKKTVYSYDKSWRVQMVVSDTEPTVSYNYDAAGRVLTETIGGEGGREEDQLVTSYTYDIYGHVETATDAKGNRTTYRYDGNGNLTETEDATGRVIYSKYDALNRVKETGIRAPGKDAKNIPLTYTSYSIKDHSIKEMDAVNGGSITTFYDEAGRPVKTVNGQGAVLSETIYDTEGRIIQTVDARGMVTENVYNKLWQIAGVKTGAKKGNAVSGNGLYAMTGEVRETKYAYDELGRNTKVTDAKEGVSSVVFDGLGRISSLKDPNQNALEDEEKPSVNSYEYTYNAQGLVEQETNAIGNVTQYQYNDRMLLQKMTDSANQETEYTYDSLNRLEKVKDDLSIIKYTYDANGNITKVEEKDKGITNLFTATKTIHREFDELNRVTKYTDYKGREVKYSYDALGNMVELTYPGGATVKYAYRNDGQVETMTSNSGGTLYTWEYKYDNYGRLRYIIRPDGTKEFRNYNDAGDLVEQVDMKGDTVIQKNTYEYDVFGEITEKSTSNTADPAGLVTVSMKYDAANRLTSYTKEGVTQEVLYDEKGNMTFGPVDGEMQELTYDCRNRLIEAGGVTYAYDAENTRISTTVDGRTTEYVTDTGGSLSRMLIAYEADGTETSYYYGAEGLSGQYNSGTKEKLYYHYDNIGSTTLLTDVAGKVVDRFVYGTYGELLSEVTKKVRFLFNGAYGVTTDENGLYYMRARYYNPDIKRFINQDIKVGDIGSSQSLNRYAYCEGNPVSLIDPFGLSPEATQDQGEESKYQWLHNLLGWGGIVWDGFDLIDGLIYWAEGNKLKAVISLACGIPVFGNFVAGVARGAKTVKAISATAKLVDACTTVGKIGNFAAGVQAAYETYQYAQTMCKTTEEKASYIAGTVITSFLMGKAAKWGAGKLKNLASKAMPKFKTTLQAGAGKFVSKISGVFSSPKSLKDGKGTTLVTHRGTNEHIERVLQRGFIKAYGPKTHIDALIDHKNPAVWVSEGKPTWFNRIFSGMVGKRGEASITFEVSSDLIKKPSGIKKIFGKIQRVIEQDVEIPVNVIVRKR